MVSFVESLRNNERPKVDEVDGKLALEIAVAATQSYQTGKTIRLDGHTSNSKLA